MGNGSLREEVLKLPRKERALLAAELLASLDEPGEADASSSWETEIDRRLAGIQDGSTQLLDWSEVRTRIRAPRARPSESTRRS